MSNVENATSNDEGFWTLSLTITSSIQKTDESGSTKGMGADTVINEPELLRYSSANILDNGFAFKEQMVILDVVEHLEFVRSYRSCL